MSIASNFKHINLSAKAKEFIPRKAAQIAAATKALKAESVIAKQEKKVRKFSARLPKQMKMAVNKRMDFAQSRLSSSAPDSGQSFLADMGSKLGGLVGDKWAGVGAGLGGMVSKILGFGDYEVKSNTVAAEMQNSGLEAMHSSTEAVVLHHKEYIGSISMTTAYTATVYAINPGLSSVFPWAGPIAQNFQQYRIKGMVFEYKSISAPLVSTANPAMGAVILASQYNIYSPPLNNKSMADNNEWTTTNRPDVSFFHPVECSPGLVPYNLYNIRTGAVPTGQDARLYDMLYLNVATVGGQSAQVGTQCGELWCTYEIELHKPLISGALGYGMKTSSYILAPSNTNVFASNTVVYDNMQLGLSGNTLTLPAGLQGTFRWMVIVNAASGLGSANPSLTLTNAAIQTGYLGASYYWTQNGNATFIQIIDFDIINPDYPAVVLWNNATTIIGSGVSMSGRNLVMQMNGHFYAPATITNILSASAEPMSIESKNFVSTFDDLEVKEDHFDMEAAKVDVIQPSLNLKMPVWIPLPVKKT